MYVSKELDTYSLFWRLFWLENLAHKCHIGALGGVSSFLRSQFMIGFEELTQCVACSVHNGTAKTLKGDICHFICSHLALQLCQFYLKFSKTTPLPPPFFKMFNLSFKKWVVINLKCMFCICTFINPSKCQKKKKLVIKKYLNIP